MMLFHVLANILYNNLTHVSNFHAPNEFFHVDTIPHLATGKMDLRHIRELAARFSAEKAPEDEEAA